MNTVNSNLQSNQVTQETKAVETPRKLSGLPWEDIVVGFCDALIEQIGDVAKQIESMQKMQNAIQVNALHNAGSKVQMLETLLKYQSRSANKEWFDKVIKAWGNDMPKAKEEVAAGKYSSLNEAFMAYLKKYDPPAQNSKEAQEDKDIEALFKAVQEAKDAYGDGDFSGGGYFDYMEKVKVRDDLFEKLGIPYGARLNNSTLRNYIEQNIYANRSLGKYAEPLKEFMDNPDIASNFKDELAESIGSWYSTANGKLENFIDYNSTLSTQMSVEMQNYDNIKAQIDGLDAKPLEQYASSLPPMLAPIFGIFKDIAGQ